VAVDNSRAQVRRNAIVALSAALKDKAVPDYLAALDDQAPEVAAEAAASLTTYADEATDRPKNAELIGKLREHAAMLRNVFTSPNATARYNAAFALNLIGDPEVDLATVLTDPVAIVRMEGLGIAASRKLGPADVKVLDTLARKDPDSQLRIQAVTVVVLRAPPDLATPVLAAAFERGDVDLTTANAAEDQRLIAALPAILAYLRAHPYDVSWVSVVKSFNAPCAARTLAMLLSNNMSGSEALATLRSLSGKASATAEQLIAWAQTQPDDTTPCVLSKAP
jgi:HEAT repeat protein